ncbi:MAG: cell division protein FtsZ [Bacteroidaceae bacterium]|nr:cell division protein FtsZ [Bacteroidaceae bacterium]
MEEKIEGIQFTIPTDKTEHLIKVIGVGGGGGNAVKSMYEKGVKNVTFAVCNTDSQALSRSPIPVRIQLGEEGLGVGGNPEKGREKAEESMKDIELLFNDETKMVFLTAGLGGGTGTGAAPLIAKVAREKGILTVGVVTLPFRFEKRARMEKALAGVEEMKENVDALLVVSNERLLEVYSNSMLSIDEAFGKANDILTIATKTISEVITKEGIVNRDFKDVETVMKDSGRAIVTVGYGSGEKRIIKAMKDALNSPLLNTKEIEKAQRLLYIIYSCNEKPVSITELGEINDFMDTLPEDLEVLWGLYPDDTIGDQVKVAVVATGFDKARQQKDSEKSENVKKLWDMYYPEPKPLEQEEAEPLEDSPEEEEEEPLVGWKERGQSWFKSFVEFMKKSLEEE